VWKIASSLPAWWNVGLHGGFDLADRDPEICDDMVTVFTWIAREETLSYSDAYKPEIVGIIRRWRPHIEID
jgi:hypothetical protein